MQTRAKMRYAGKGSGWGVLTGEEAQLLLTKKKKKKKRVR